MKKGKLILIEGTDCSGKQTQTELLTKRLQDEGIPVKLFSFPTYETPTGKIIGGPYLGKEHISEGYFPEGAVNVDPKVAALYYAADRKYNIGNITDLLDKGTNIILDRYVFSNMAHQGGKLENKNDRLETYAWLDKLEFGFLELLKPDKSILLYMPHKHTVTLKKDRTEKPDQHEACAEHLESAERAYLEIAEIYNFEIVKCVKIKKIRTPEDIHNEVYKLVKLYTD